ncbi:MAG: Asp-tRNA(Asn)/Glu-tRNA(Gln) amidotransferase GatCAB subunit A, partial [Pseudomonadales bacterium]|nr:Asp-tRNA(Asn)/Glu-tRNA(Gln) amidotransferase GatCAB subunit A [Pseudomonadales bacterium]
IDCLKEAGAQVRDVSVPCERIARGWPITCAVEAAHAHEATYPARRGDYGPIADLLELGRSLPASAYLEQEIARRGFKATLDGIFQDVDLVICPSMAYATVPREGSREADEVEQDLGRTLRYTAPFDYSGSPTISLPWKIGSNGVPLSVQLVARDFEEPLLVRTGAVLERLGGYGDNHPEIG